MSSEYNFEFVSAPPPVTRGRNAMYAAFAQALKDRPGEWAKWPRSFDASNVASATRRNIVSGKMANFPEGQFEAQCSKSTVYVRFLGNGGTA